MAIGKLPAHMQDKISYLYYQISDKISPSLKKISNNKLTPSTITAIRLLVFIISIYNIYLENYLLGAILFNIYYFMDCLDGSYARKYDMVTIFGDYFDHVVDTICFTIILLMILYKFQINYILIVLILLINSVFHIGCEEQYIKLQNSNHNNTLNIMRSTCKFKKKDMENYLTYGGFFGAGTLHIVIGILIYYYKSVSR